MLSALKEEANMTRTENGALSYLSSGSACLDMFSSIGSMRHRKMKDIEKKFAKSFYENPTLSLKMAFYARDIRAGLGERAVSRVIFHWLANHAPEAMRKNLSQIPVFGRYDDLLVFLGTPVETDMIQLIAKQLEKDKAALAEEKPISLLAKWLPSVNTSSWVMVCKAQYLCKALSMSEAEYRRTLSSLRKAIPIIENSLRTKDYSFDYAKQTGGALYKYKKAFLRHDKERYETYCQAVSEGKATMHAATLYPYQVVHTICDEADQRPLTQQERMALDTTWNALPDLTQKENALAVIDGSGSMYSYTNPSPIEVAISLGLYFAERNTGAFQNHFITFSEHPRLIEIKGKDICDKVTYCMSYDECANTNVQKVFELLLRTALRYHVPQEEMTSKLYFITDMEFDCCTESADMTNFAYAKELFQKHGYTLPQIVFWNVDSRNEQVPVKSNEQNVTLVSGMSPQIFRLVTSQNCTPYQFMVDTLCSERYRAIEA